LTGTKASRRRERGTTDWASTRTCIGEAKGLQATRRKGRPQGPRHRIDENLKPIDKNQGIASTRTRDYRLRIDENLDHSP